MMTETYRVLLGVLCVWRITHLLQAEDGPWDVVLRIRKAAGDRRWGRLLDCFYCLSLWVSLPFSWFIGQTVAERGLLWLSLSAGAIVLERATGDRGANGGKRLADFVEDESEVK
jgi:hypothetical protein